MEKRKERKERNIRMGTARFLDHVKEGYDAGLRYCFILGSGASVSSGISSGKTLMMEWRQYLLEKRQEDANYIEECAADIGIDREKWQPLFLPDYEAKSEDYFTFYDLRFAGKPVSAYTYLQKLMEKAEPSFGYYALAVLLENTENKLVITTNFDSLVEDTLFLYHAQHPLVVGHESLAPFIGKKESAGRPVVAKVHRDLFLHPLNREKELEELDERWKKELRTAFTHYIPIIVGYGGGDQTLMKLLEEMQLEEIYWCSRHAKEDSRIEDLLQKQARGYLVHIEGFDEIMFKLLRCLMQNKEYDPPGKRMKDFVLQRSESYEKQYLKISKSIAEAASAERAPIRRELDDSGSPKTEQAASYGKELTGSLQVLKNMAPEETPTEDDAQIANRLYIDASLAASEDDYEKAIKGFSEAIKYDPNVPEYYHSRASSLYNLGRYDQSIKDMSAAIRLDPDDAWYYDNRGDSLYKMGKYKEALDDYTMALQLDPNEACFYYDRGRALLRLGQKEEALEFFSKAIRLDNGQAWFYHNRGDAQLEAGNASAALRDYSKSIDLDHSYPGHYYKRATALEKLGRYNEAEADRKKARQLEEQRR